MLVPVCAQTVDQLRAGEAEQRGQRMRAQAGERQSQLKLRTTIGRQETAIAGKCGDAFHQGAEKFGPAMKGNLQVSRERYW